MYNGKSYQLYLEILYSDFFTKKSLGEWKYYAKFDLEKIDKR